MGWGGPRPGAGRRPLTPEERARRQKDQQPAARRTSRPRHDKLPPHPQPKPTAAALSMDDIRELLALSQRGKVARTPEHSPFRIVADLHPPIARPKDRSMAMDSAITDTSGWATAAWTNAAAFGVLSEGLAFLGFPILAEMSLRPEYRTISEIIATECTRKWIKFNSTTGTKKNSSDDTEGDTDDPVGAEDAEPDKADNPRAMIGGNDPPDDEEPAEEDDKSDKIRELEDFLDALMARDRCREIIMQDGWFGRSHLALLFNDQKVGPDATSTDNDELKVPIGNGRDDTSKAKIPKGTKMRLQTVEAVWTYPMGYNATNPLAPEWYNPQRWYILGTEIHASRLLTFVGRPVPDLIKPSFSFGGLSLTQVAKPYVDIWLQTREAVAALIHSFSTMVLSTDLASALQPGGAANLLARAALFNTLRDNHSLMMVNKGTEEFSNVTTPLSGLEALQAQAQEHMFSVSRIPAVKFAGIQPAGLNASSEGEIRVFYDTIAAYQQAFLRPNLTRLIDFAMLCLWGEVDDDITFEFLPLWELTEKEKAEARKADAETASIHIQDGVISPEEERKRIAADPEGLYTGIDPNDVPEPPQPEMGAEGGEFGGGPDETGGTKPTKPGITKPNGGERGGASDAVLPFAADEFREDDHPRAPDGKFGSGGGGIKRGKPSKTVSPLQSKNLRKVGGQMGSNPGGVFEDDSGARYYVKKGQSPAHVRNELAAAALYQLADAPTLKYRPVDGGNFIATEMESLGKKRAQDFTAAERKQAQEDFAVHAWLANWDAVGLEGDNQGTVNGVPTSLDLGGALAYRAQGAPKGQAFGTSVGEFDTLRDPKVNPISAKMFGSMTPEQLSASVGKVASIPDEAIRKTIEAAGESKDLADKLIARKRDLAKRVGMATDASWEESKHPRAPDGKFGSGGSAAGAITKVLPETKTALEDPNFPSTMEMVNQRVIAQGGKPLDADEMVVARAYMGAGARAINSTLRSGATLSKEERVVVETMDRALAKLPAYSGPAVRAINVEPSDLPQVLKQYQPGATVEWPGYSSASAGAQTATAFRGSNVAFEIESKGGARNFSGVSAFGGGEREVIFGRGSKFTVRAVKRSGDKVRIQLQEVASGRASDALFNDPDRDTQYWIDSTFRRRPLEVYLTVSSPQPPGALHMSSRQEPPGEFEGEGGEIGSDSAGWEESKHPRVKGGPDAGQFAPAGGGGSSAALSQEPGESAASEEFDPGAEFDNFVEATLNAGHLTASQQAAKIKAFAQENDVPDDMLEGVLQHLAGQASASAPESPPAFASKKDHAKHLLTQEEGVTTKQMLEALGWPSISMPAMAKTLGLKLTQTKVGGVTKYKGVPMTPAEQAAAKAEAAQKKKTKVAAPTPPAPTPPPAASPAPGNATPAELEAAKKPTKMATPPGASPAGAKLVDAFNEKYAGKTLSDPVALQQKVADFKTLKAEFAAANEAHAAKAKAEQEAKNKAAAAALKKQQEEAAAKTKQYMAELGISETEAAGFNALVNMMGGGSKDLIEKFKGYELQAKKHGYDISGFQYALIRNYINGGYVQINAALREGSWTPDQHVYARMVNAAIDKIPKYTGTVERGTTLSAEQLAAYKPGHVVEERAFTSTGINYKFGGNVKYTIKSIGKRGADFSKGANAGEREVLFKAHTFFLVHKVEKKGGVTHIEMEEVEGHG